MTPCSSLAAGWTEASASTRTAPRPRPGPDVRDTWTGSALYWTPTRHSWRFGVGERQQVFAGSLSGLAKGRSPVEVTDPHPRRLRHAE